MYDIAAFKVQFSMPMTHELIYGRDSAHDLSVDFSPSQP